MILQAHKSPVTLLHTVSEDDNFSIPFQMIEMKNFVTAAKTEEEREKGERMSDKI